MNDITPRKIKTGGDPRTLSDCRNRGKAGQNRERGDREGLSAGIDRSWQLEFQGKRLSEKALRTSFDPKDCRQAG